MNFDLDSYTHYVWIPGMGWMTINHIQSFDHVTYLGI